jgi:hypothetical protein
VLTPAAGFGVPPAVQGLVASVSLFLFLLRALVVAGAGAIGAALRLARG